MNIPGILSYSDLAKLLNLSKRQLVSFVKSSGIKTQGNGNKDFVLLSELKKHHPEIYETILLMNQEGDEKAGE